MPITFVSAAGNGSSGSSFSVNITSAQQGDVVYVFYACYSSQHATLNSTGYTELVNLTDGSSFIAINVYRKIMGSTPDTSVSFGSVSFANHHALT